MARGNSMKTWAIAAALAALSAVPALAVDRTISFRDQVREISLAPTGDFYRVVFRGRAAYYRVRKQDRTTASCLQRSARSSKEVLVKADGETLMLLDCRI